MALEGVLKLKEISYIHAEGLAGGEIKRHTLAVLSHKTPVIALLARDNTYEAMLTNIKESYGEILEEKSLLRHYYHCCHRCCLNRAYLVEF